MDFLRATFSFSSIQLPIYVTLDRGSLFFDQTLPYLDLGTCKLRGVGSFALERLIELDLDAGFFWDVLSNGGSMQEMARITNGRD
ncbi:hypothetical protein Tco_0511734 [Tanacetum coccineum]